ncbi:MAG: TrbC/VirB2 family protein [Alphaproteobacteria bacterium]|nr:TrbC/VirB2 family protein [Alphaproteobacteria bacterium]
MLCVKMKKFIQENKWTIGLVLSLFLCTTDVFAADGEVFGALKNAGNSIFLGLRQVIYPAATIGVACVCIAGMFGNFNWKWLAAILIGIFVITYATAESGPSVVDLVGNS